VDLELTAQLEILLAKLTYSDEESESGWAFSLVDDYVILFQPFGYLNEANFKLLAKSFNKLRTEYFKNAEFLIFLFDFTNFKKASSDVRAEIIEASLFRDNRISFAIYGMNNFVSIISKVISKRLFKKRLFIVKNKDVALEKAKALISDYQLQKIKELHINNYYVQPEKTVEVGGKSYTVLTRQNWTYNDPHSDFAFKIDLIDSNILVGRPSGYIKYQNFVMSNVLFDKVVNTEIKGGGKYYRIQDYTSVIGTENKARRDFLSYIINEIGKINLLVFYGLNRTMKTVVRLGKLVHPALEKVRITDTFENALELVIADKYKNSLLVEKTKTKEQIDSKDKSPEEEISDLKTQIKISKKENNRLIQILFDQISKIAYSVSGDFLPIKLDENDKFYDLFGAVQLLQEDFEELRKDLNDTRDKFKRLLLENAREIKDLKIDNSLKLKTKNDFILKSGHELKHSLEAILNAIQLSRYEEKPEIQKTLFDIINMASITLQDNINQLSSNITDNYTNDVISESMFNYRKNIVQLVEIFRLGVYNSNVVFENKVEDGLPTFLIGDKRKLNQILSVYLENAIKYTGNGFIKVNTQLVERTATQVRFRVSVEDTGKGIDKYTKALIFKDEFIGDSNINGEETGFGLFIAKSLAKVLNAEIGFESEENVGSKFWLELTLNIGYHDKVSQMHAVRKQRKSKKNLPFEGNRALLIFDDNIERNILNQILIKKGIQTHIKLNHEFFGDIKGKFDFVFLNLELTGGEELNGFKLFKDAMDAKNDFAPIVYIASVDATTDTIIEEYRRTGVDYFINKSFNIDDIDRLFEDLK